MDSVLGYDQARDLLEWQVELGADEAIGDLPINRYELPAQMPGGKAQAKPQQPASPPARPKPAVPQPMRANPPEPSEADAVLAAKAAASAADDLPALQQALADFSHCELKQGARNLVFADGNPAARLMIIGEAPGRDEDRIGRPFVGRAGQLLDKMLAAIDLGREGPDPSTSVYISNILPWRPPHNRNPNPAEIAMMLPFVQRHIALVDPDMIVLMGNIACQALLGRAGITRLRGHWQQVQDRPALPMFHPAYLLRSPHLKREAWADLLELKSKLLATA
ncbi:MAG: uracil-DNA glycosylase [Rhodobacterales bacterium]|nr:MAG: uracil-DNA glycosylase [Rhodobacterales bacterium]